MSRYPSAKQEEGENPRRNTHHQGRCRAAVMGCCAALAVFVLTGCEKSVSASDRHVYPARGVIQEIDPDGKTVVIRHDAISNYMAAMTMPFEVRDTNELRGLKAGDAINFHLVVTSKEGWVEDITKGTNVRQLAVAPPPRTPINPALVPLDEGDLLPDFYFTNELGQAVHLNQYRGGVLAFTFFFTSCPFPNFCPRMTGNFEETSAELRGLTNAPRWHLLSISFDTKTDTPEHLLNYAKGAQYDPEHWSFLTGAPRQIESLGDLFGQTYWVENGSISHNLRTVVIDPNGRVRKIFVGNTWTPSDLITAMLKAAKAGHG